MVRDNTLMFKKCEALPFVTLCRANGSSACYHIHSHDEFSFGVIDAGEADYRNMRHQHHIGAGTTVTINPGDAHSCNPRAGRWSYRMLFVDTAWVGSLQQEMCGSALDYLPFAGQLVDDSGSFAQFAEIFESLSQADNTLAAESLLMAFFERHFAPDSSAGSRRVLIEQRGLARVRELLLDRLDANVSLDELSAASGLSRYHLIRSFKQQYGQSPHAFQLDHRINRAKGLLERGDSLSDTALQLGFADQSHFQRHFKKRLAVTPKQYQSFFL